MTARTPFPTPMLRIAPLLACLGLLASPAALAAKEDVVASTGTKRISFAAREWLEVALDVQGVTVDRLRIQQPGKFKGLFTDHDRANRGKIAITNGTDRKIRPSVAIAVFDAEGHLLAAANTGAKQIPIKPGVSKEMDIHFGGVFQHIESGGLIYVTLEY